MSVTHLVQAGESVQAALDRAVSGDEVVLAAGATYPGTLVLHPKGTPDVPVIVRGPAPLPDRRITAADAGPLPKLVSGTTDPAVTTDGGGGYRFVGVEFLPNAQGMYSVVYTPGATDHLAFDRCVVIGDETHGQKNAFALNGAHISVQRCHLANLWFAGEESHAFVAWDGPGPYLLQDNYLEAASIGILFGGADSASPEWLPSDVVIEDNDVTKRLAWRDGGKAVKNALELKAARRVLVRRNRFSQVWTDAQAGYAILLTVRNQEGRAPWSTVADVLFTGNVITDVEHGLNIGGTDDQSPSTPARNLQFFDNVWDVRGNFALIGSEAHDVGIERTTITNGGALIVFTGGWVRPAGEDPRPARFAVENFAFRNNLASLNEYGCFGDGGVPWTDYVAGTLAWTHNVLANRYGSAAEQTHPGVNWYPTAEAHAAQFDPPGSATLAAGSPYQTAATDGGPLGSRAEAPLPEPPVPPDPGLPDTEAPAVAIVGVVRHGKSRVFEVAAEARDTVGVVRVEFYVESTLHAVLTLPPYLAMVKVPNRAAAITVRAFDAAGNVSDDTWAIR